MRCHILPQGLTQSRISIPLWKCWIDSSKNDICTGASLGVWINEEKHSDFFQFFTVSKYTREAGVRNLERKIGGICRAVAVRVAESTSKNKTEKTDNINQTDKKKMVNDSLPEKASHEASTLAHPPEMPIVIDDLAVEDILGVSTTCIYTRNK